MAPSDFGVQRILTVWCRTDKGQQFITGCGLSLYFLIRFFIFIFIFFIDRIVGSSNFFSGRDHGFNFYIDIFLTRANRPTVNGGLRRLKLNGTLSAIFCQRFGIGEFQFNCPGLVAIVRDDQFMVSVSSRNDACWLVANRGGANRSVAKP